MKRRSSTMPLAMAMGLSAKPTAEIEAPDCPDHLDDVARAEWERLATGLHQLGFIANIDRGALACYCVAWSRWVEAEQALRVANGDGFAVEQATWLVAANKAMDQLRTFGADLGLSPAARKKLDMALPEKHWLNTFAS